MLFRSEPQPKHSGPKLQRLRLRLKALLRTAPKAPSSRARIPRSSAWKTCLGRERARKLRRPTKPLSPLLRLSSRRSKNVVGRWSLVVGQPVARCRSSARGRWLLTKTRTDGLVVGRGPRYYSPEGRTSLAQDGSPGSVGAKRASPGRDGTGKLSREAAAENSPALQRWEVKRAIRIESRWDGTNLITQKVRARASKL